MSIRIIRRLQGGVLRGTARRLRLHVPLGGLVFLQLHNKAPLQKEYNFQLISRRLISSEISWPQFSGLNELSFVEEGIQAEDGRRPNSFQAQFNEACEVTEKREEPAFPCLKFSPNPVKSFIL